MPHKNSSHFGTFGHGYWEIIYLELWKNWVWIPYLTIVFSDQFQKKIINSVNLIYCHEKNGVLSNQNDDNSTFDKLNEKEFNNYLKLKIILI